MLPGEHIIFNTTVEPGGPKRRASRLLAMAVAPKKHRPRELVLTTQRLLCVKQKPGRAVQVRTELFVRPSEREKELRNLVSSVEPKGEREFVVITVSARRSQTGRVDPDWSSVQPVKSHCYVAASASIAATWIRKLREAIEAQPSAVAGATRAAATATGTTGSTATATTTASATCSTTTTTTTNGGGSHHIGRLRLNSRT